MGFQINIYNNKEVAEAVEGFKIEEPKEFKLVEEVKIKKERKPRTKKQ